MNTFKRKSLAILTGVIMAFAAAIAMPVPAQAATPNYGTNVAIVAIPFHISGQYTASQAGVVRFAMPFKAKLIGVGAAARASGGTTPTLTVDVKAGGTTLLSAPISVTAATYTEGTVATSTIADESTMTIDLTIGGTSPTWNDITVFLTVARL